MAKRIGILVGVILLCLVAGGLGGLITNPAIDSWYALLNKPSFSPPNWLFAPVWSILYILMGIALFLVIDSAKKKFSDKKSALRAFAAQLILNFLWTFFFFGLQLTWLAFAEIVILWIMILYTIAKFYTISRIAAFLLVPYILWVTFAVVLNFAVAWIN